MIKIICDSDGGGRRGAGRAGCERGGKGGEGGEGGLSGNNNYYYSKFDI